MDPFQEQFTVSLPDGSIANDGAYKIVPAGKLAVIEHVSVWVEGAGAANGLYFITSVISGTNWLRVPIVTQIGPNGDVIGSHPCRAFAGSGTQFGAIVWRLKLAGAVQASFVLAGYYTPA
jgi:hypothetical protein